MRKLVSISAAVLVSLGSIIGGGYWIGETAYKDGLTAGITAVVEQCAAHSSTIYNAHTGDVMVCEGGHVGEPEKTPGNGLSVAPSASPDAHEGSPNSMGPSSDAGEPGKKQDDFYEQNNKEKI